MAKGKGKGKGKGKEKKAEKARAQALRGPLRCPPRIAQRCRSLATWAVSRSASARGAGSSRASCLQADAAGGAEEAVAGDEPPKPKVLELLNSAACAWPPSLAQPQAGAPAATSALRYARRRKKGLTPYCASAMIVGILKGLLSAGQSRERWRRASVAESSSRGCGGGHQHAEQTRAL